MRNLEKRPCPQVLTDNAETWTEEYAADPENKTKRCRYRHPDIKAELTAETSNKCVYCESKVGHNTPGDVEHKVPTAADRNQHFSWANLTIACTECNRRKRAYFDKLKPFLDPYVDDVESRVVHHGPVVAWNPGDESSEITVKTLELHDSSRSQLLMRKIEKIGEVNELLARKASVESAFVKELLDAQIEQMQNKNAEYSAMVQAVCSVGAPDG